MATAAQLLANELYYSPTKTPSATLVRTPTTTATKKTVTTPRAPAPTPTNVGTGATGGGGVAGSIQSVDTPMETSSGGGFDEAAYRAEQERLLNEQIDASYNPAYENLRSVQAQYEQEYPTSQKMIEQGFAEAIPQLESEQSAKLGNVATQRRKGQQEEKNQFSTARQKYNELRAGLVTRFGGSSSTGEATQELLGRASSQEMAGIDQNFGNLYTDMDAEEKNINNFYIDKKSNLEKEKNLKLEQLKNQFDASIREINSKRFSLDSEKAARRLASLQEFSAQARQIQYDSQKFQQQLDLWRSAKDETLALAKQFGAKSFSMPGIPGVL